MTTAQHDSTLNLNGLYMAFELSEKTWVLAFGTPGQEKRRQRRIEARNVKALEAEIAKAKGKLQLASDAKVFSCYEAGRDGFWLHRALEQRGVQNVVVDSSSIEVNRRQRRAKTDRLDAGKLLEMLLRHHRGERKVWAVVRVPAAEQEYRRQPHRELRSLQQERTSLTNQIAGHLATVGLACRVLDKQAIEDLPGLSAPDGKTVPGPVLERIRRIWERVELLDQQVGVLKAQRRQEMIGGTAPDMGKVRALMSLGAVGPVGAHVLVRECFGWRNFTNRRQVGGFFGLTPSPYHSGSKRQEMGVGGAGEPQLRSLTIELAWGWLRYQPKSSLSRWYQHRFGEGGKRQRRIGIVALARRLMIALWRYVEHGELPEGATIKPWWQKLSLRHEPDVAAVPAG